MAGSPIKRERRERTQSFIDSPNAIDELCGSISAGNTLAMFCRDYGKDEEHPEVPHGITYGLVNAWIQADADRRKRYAEVLDVREKHHKDEVVHELVSYLRADITQAFNDDGSLKRIADMPESVRRLISGIEYEEIFDGKGDDRKHVGTMHKLKFYDKIRGIDTLARHLKMLQDSNTTNLKVTLADLIGGDDPQQPKAPDGEARPDSVLPPTQVH